MVKDNLGDRMKEFYENRSKTYLCRRMPAIIRIDGCHFHSFTRGFKKPYDKIFIKTMQRTTQALCENIQGCKIGYVESDEISLLITDYDSLQTSAWFEYAVQKMCSVAASMASMFFNRFFAEEANSYIKENSNVEAEKKYIDTLTSRINIGGYFDARVFNIPEKEVVNYFIWRQNDASRNSIQGLGHHYFSDKEMLGKNNSQIQDMLHEQKGVNWNDFTPVEKRGSAVIRKTVTEDVSTPKGILPVTRSKWVIDENMSIITQDKSYIEAVLPKVE